jgi:peptidoglycan DL-endopeptidase CwlO
MTVSVGIVGTLAIPAYAFAPGSAGPQFETSAQTELTQAQAQSVEVTDDVIAAPVTKDGACAWVSSVCAEVSNWGPALPGANA